MGMRKYKRQVAKARMRIIGFEQINKNFGVVNTDGVANWRLALMDKNAERAQVAKRKKAKRKLKKVERTA